MRTILVASVVLAGLAHAQTFSGGTALDAVVEKAVADQLIPGAVLLVGHDGKVVHRKAYGSRALTPEREPMTEDTIFDAASLTKVVATSASMMRLVEDGKVRTQRSSDPIPARVSGLARARSRCATC